MLQGFPQGLQNSHHEDSQLNYNIHQLIRIYYTRQVCHIENMVGLDTWKRTILEDLNAKITNVIEEKIELTDKICKVEEYKIVMLERITLLKSFITSLEFSVLLFTVFLCINSLFLHQPPVINQQLYSPMKLCPISLVLSENEQPLPLEIL